MKIDREFTADVVEHASANRLFGGRAHALLCPFPDSRTHSYRELRCVPGRFPSVRRDCACQTVVDSHGREHEPDYTAGRRERSCSIAPTATRSLNQDCERGRIAQSATTEKVTATTVSMPRSTASDSGDSVGVSGSIKESAKTVITTLPMR